ncbi:MAG TPA: nucleoid-associated protein [Anaerolineae bacterium]|nr:nucleoid-associated protein [Anaerolineae bacterium]
MRYATGIHIDELVVHILDHRSGNQPILSETPCPLAGREQLTTYFTAHIENSLADPSARAARFVSLDPAATAGLCQALLEGRLDLVTGSRELATRLFGVMKGNPRISPGDLAVCFYRAETHPNARYLGLLKLDPSTVFRHKTERDTQGRLFVNFELQPDALPTTREKLQKCAFIRPLEPRLEYDMILLDRQARERVARPVAEFFAKGFLGCEWALDNRERTDRLYKGLLSACNRLRPQLSPAEEERLRRQVEAAISSRAINLDHWLAAVPLEEEQRQVVDETLTAVLPDREFELDTEYAEKLVQKRRFRGDWGLRVEVRGDKYGEVIKEVRRVDEPGEPPYFRVVIHTQKWQEVRR